MFAEKIRSMKAECWQSRWRAVGTQGGQRPRHYVALTNDEMLHAATYGEVRIPESALPPAMREAASA